MKQAIRSFASFLFLGVALGVAVHNVVTPEPLVAQRPACTAEEGKLCRTVIDCPTGPDGCTSTN